MLESEIILFANAYSCPLEKRCKDCALKNLTEVSLREVYGEVGKLSYSEKESLVKRCIECQESQSAANEVEEGIS